MSDIDRATALALIAGRLSDYPVIRRLPDDLKAELEPLERGKHYGAIIERLVAQCQSHARGDDVEHEPPTILHAIVAAAKAQESRLAACGRELANAYYRNEELRAALAKSAEDAGALAILRERFPDFAREIETLIEDTRERE
jgi:hypothetical protein